MKLDIFESHDRYKHVMQDQSINLSQGAEDCLKKNSLSLALQSHSPYVYLWAHPRTNDDGFTKRMLWQPRLGKPKAQTNSYLFRAQSNTDIVEVCWLLPPREMWPAYKKGNVTESELVNWSIEMFQNKREELEKPYPDDYSEEQIKAIYLAIGSAMDEENRMKKLYPKLNSEAVYSALL